MPQDQNGKKLRVGSRVEARFKGKSSKYYPGVITSITPNAEGSSFFFGLRYDDGDLEEKALGSNMRRLGGGEEDEEEMVVEGKQKPEQTTQQEVLQSAGAAASAAGSAAAASPSHSPSPSPSPSGEEGITLPMCLSDGTLVGQDCEGKLLTVGDAVTARFQGKSKKWYPGRITAAKLPADASVGAGSTMLAAVLFSILYDDGDKEENAKCQFVKREGAGRAEEEGLRAPNQNSTPDSNPTPSSAAAGAGAPADSSSNTYDNGSDLAREAASASAAAVQGGSNSSGTAATGGASGGTGYAPLSREPSFSSELPRNNSLYTSGGSTGPDRLEEEVQGEGRAASSGGGSSSRPVPSSSSAGGSSSSAGGSSSDFLVEEDIPEDSGVLAAGEESLSFDGRAAGGSSAAGSRDRNMNGSSSSSSSTLGASADAKPATASSSSAAPQSQQQHLH